MDTYYLIDYENVGNQGLTGCENMKSTDHIIIFFTANANKIDLSVIAHHGSAEINVLEIPAGKQSADMHISSYLGYLSNQKNCSIVIVSNDKDYDNVIKFWKKELGITAARKSQINKKANTTVSKPPADSREARIRNIFEQKFNKKPYKEKKEEIIKALLTEKDKSSLNNKLTKLIPSSNIPPIYKEFKDCLSALPSSPPQKKTTKKKAADHTNQFRSIYGQFFKNGIYKEKRDKIINILLNATTRDQLNSELCKIIPSKNASAVIQRFKPLLKDLP